MHFKNVCYTVGIAIHAVSIVALPIGGKQIIYSVETYLSFRLHKADFYSGPSNTEIAGHQGERNREGISARSPEDVVPAAICKRAHAAEIDLNEALYRRCDEGEGEGEEENESSGEGEGDDDEDDDAENDQTASNSPRLDCIRTQMARFQSPDFALCESLPDTPPATDPAPPVTPPPPPPPPPAEPVPAPAPAPIPARKPVPVNAGGFGREPPKRLFEARVLES